MRVHFVGICGKAMGAIAMALADAGHVVTGSDERVYPPMSDLLAGAGIAVTTPFGVDVPADSDVVVIGRRLTQDNQEVRAAAARGLRCVSFPVLLRDWFLHRSRNLVVGGGVGKTTTSAMLAWILQCDGLEPDYLIGGVPSGLTRPARLRGAPLCVLEGDEYASAPDDPTPKFLHYLPDTLVLTNTLDDHPDLYADRASLVDAFGAAVRLVPAHGCVILGASDPATSALSSIAACRVLTVGEEAAADVRIDDLSLSAAGSNFTLRGVRFALQSFGRMNVRNAAMAALAAEHAGVPLARSASALATFLDVANRQQAVPVAAATLILDKATHPASIGELHDALRQRYPGRRLTVLIRPRATGGRDWIYQRDLPAALSPFDRVVVTPAYEHRPPVLTRWAETPFSADLLVEQLLARGCDAQLTPDGHPLPSLDRLLVDDDVVVLLFPEAHAAGIGDAVAALAARQQPLSVL